MSLRLTDSKPGNNLLFVNSFQNVLETAQNGKYYIQETNKKERPPAGASFLQETTGQNTLYAGGKRLLNS